MNGEVSIISDRRENVIAVPNEAIRSMREAAQAATILGLNPDSVTAQIRAGMGAAFGGMGGGMPAGMPAGAGRPTGAPAAAQMRPGFADFSQQGGQGGAGGFQMPQVTDAQCKAVTDARTAKPAAAKKVDDLSAQLRDPNADRQKLMTDVRAAYTELGVDMTVARACRMREAGGEAPGTARPATSGTRPQGVTTGAAPAAANGAARRGGRASTRSGLVFVQKADSSWEARIVRLGVADYDFTEVVSGLEEGERVALLSAAALQMQRQENNDRFRAMTGGGSPLGGGAAPGAGGGGRPAGGAPAGGPPR
jgi:HlyD family secretion protein